MVVFLIGFYLGAGAFHMTTKWKVTGSVTFREAFYDVLGWPIDFYKMLKG